MDFIDMSTTMMLPALGRPLHLGMLYDCRKDAMIPGVTLWDMETIRKDKRVTEQKTTEFKIIASDSIEERASVLDIPESLKASVLCGLVDVSGAAKYLTAKKTSKTQARVTLMHTATTTFEQMTMMHLKTKNITNTEIFDQDIGTHVVTGVLYGAQAFYVFERGVSSSESKPEIHRELQKELELAISNMSISTLMCYGCNFTEELIINKQDECKLSNTRCTFCGDYAFKATPLIDEPVIGGVKNLPAFSDTSDETPVPVKVWLSPLKEQSYMTTPVVHSISCAVIEEVQVVMETLSHLDMQCEDLLNQPAALHFADIKSKIQRFRNLCQQYRLTFQKSVADALLSIRRGDREEAALVAILTAREQSPFNTQQLTEYIESLEKEVDFVSFCLNWMKETHAINILCSQQDINDVLWDPRVELVVLFTFTSLKEEEPCFLDLKDWLQLKYMDKTSHPTSPSSDLMEKKCRKWFDDANIYQTTRTCATEFIEFASGNIVYENIQFIVSALADPGNPGASIYLYEKGVLQTKSFHPPQLNVPVIREISHDSVRLACGSCPAYSDQLLGYRMEYWSTSDNNWMIRDRKNTNQAFIVTGLLPNSLYQFRQSALLARWVTQPSNTTSIIKTLPCSPPRKVISQNCQTNFITLSWEEPENIGTDTRVTDYKIEFLQESDNVNAWRAEMTGKKIESYTVQGLIQNTRYRFRVSAICEDDGNSSPSEESVISTISFRVVPVRSFYS